MNILRSKLVSSVVAAIVIISAAIVLDVLDKHTNLNFSRRESEIITLFCYVVGFPFLPLQWAGLRHPDSYAASVLLGVVLFVLLVVIWTAIIYFVRGLYWRIRGFGK